VGNALTALLARYTIGTETPITIESPTCGRSVYHATSGLVKHRGSAVLEIGPFNGVLTLEPTKTKVE